MSKGDMGPPSRASSMHPPPRFPLMTPSASPPVQRPFGRQSSTPSPTKKRRVSRPPSVSAPTFRSFSVTPSSSSSISPAFNFDASVDPGEELHAARRASSFRVLNVWQQLAEKYATPLDEDDIVDLRKEKIIKDRGVLRSSDDMFEIGYFAEERDRAESLDNGLPLVPVDDEPDELDAFADTPDNMSRSETDVEDDDGLELSQHTKRLPPVRELDPADAADLAEFLRAEQIRKETFGDPDEGDEDDGEGASVEEDYARGSEALEEQSNTEEDFNSETVVSEPDAEEDTEYEERDSENEYEEVFEESVTDANDDGDRHGEYSRLSTPSGSPEFDILDMSNEEKVSDVEEEPESRSEEHPIVVPDEDSEDELGGWDHDEGSTLYSVDDFKEIPLDGETAENTDEPPQVVSPAKPRKNRIRGKTQKPELSQTSPSKRKPRSPSPSVIQLQTPPRSTSFGPEPSNNKITATYSRKRRGSSSSPKKTPLRIQSTESASSESESEDPISLKTRNRPSVSPQTSPTKKAKLVPEVYIDVPRPTPVRKTAKKAISIEDGGLSSPSKHSVPAKHGTGAKFKGKAKAVENDYDSSLFETDLQAKSPSSPSKVPDGPTSSRLHTTRNAMRTLSPGRSPQRSRKREHSPLGDEMDEMASRVDVVIASPSRSSFRGGSRRVSSSRRSVENGVNSHDESDPGSSSRPFRSHSSRRRSGEHVPENTSRSHPPPELDTFSFIPPHPSSVGYQSYSTPHFMPPHAHQQRAPSIPNLQDPNAQYHLAQALQSLSILMGGALPFPSPVNPPHIPHHSPTMVHNGHQPWPPYTPRHHDRSMTFDTPQSVATAPPTSPSPGSDYSDSLPSSPTKHSGRGRGRQRTKSHSSSKLARPKSAIRESRSRSRSVRRVSFSSPEATQIEDYAYEYVSDNAMKSGSSNGEDSDFERRRQRREEQSNRSSQLQSPHGHARAQTPGPPEHPLRTKPREEDTRQSMLSNTEPKRRISKTGRNVGNQDHGRRSGYR